MFLVCHPDIAYTVPLVFEGGFHAMFSPLDKPAIVYQATNKKNGKRYVGVTGRTLPRRRHEHVRDAVAGKGNGAFAHAIRKHGKDVFEWHVLSEFTTAREAVAEECRLIRETAPEYNSTFGGHGGRNEADRLKTKPRKSSASAYKGISPYTVGGRSKWRAQICVDGKKIHLGLFDTPQAGHAAYMAAAAAAGTRGR